jgi:hypothetical protein
MTQLLLAMLHLQQQAARGRGTQAGSRRQGSSSCSQSAH